jgi:hypothetical protein
MKDSHQHKDGCRGFSDLIKSVGQGWSYSSYQIAHQALKEGDKDLVMGSIFPARMQLFDSFYILQSHHVGI